MAKIKFGTSGWRDIIADNFTFENVRVVTQAIAEYIIEKNLQEKGVIVGYDTRFMAKEFATESAKVLGANEIKVFFTSRDTPTPVIAYDIIKNKRAGGVNLTASHNPPQYQGIKFSPEWGGPALPETTRWIEARIEEIQDNEEKYRIESIKSLQGRGFFEEFDPRPQYLEHISNIIDFNVIKESGLKILYNPMHGTGRGYLDFVLREYGIEVETLNENIDPLFDGRRPEPSAENLKEMSRKIKSKKFDLGLATDGDADRFGVLDKSGEYIQPNYIIALVYDYVFSEKKIEGGVARSVATSHMVDAVAKYYKQKAYETPVGFKYLGDLLSRGYVAVVGEESAGLSIKGHVPEKDGILADLLVAEMVARRGKTLKEQINDLFDKVGPFYTKRVNFPIEDEKLKQRILDFLETDIKKFAGRKVKKIIRVDGSKLIFEDGSWVLFRPSGTEPVIRFYVETHSEEDLKELIDAGERLIKYG